MCMLYYRVPELLFQPSMIGLDQAGIVETLEYVLSKYTTDLQNQLAQVSHIYHFCI